MQTEQQSLRAAAGQRFWQIDALRGLALLNMLVYHAMYDWVYIFGHASGWYDIWSTHCHVWQQYICWSFILLLGYSFTLSRRRSRTAAHGGLCGGADRGNRRCHAGRSHLVRRAAPAGLCGHADLSAAPRAESCPRWQGLRAAQCCLPC